jgi:preprotein translocase subunit SecG
MANVILGIHILVSLTLILVVLLQAGKGGGLAGAFGGGGGVGAVFGGQAAGDFLTKMTRYLAVGFMLTSLTLAMISRGRMHGTISESLENRAATPASAVGELVEPQDLPEGLPGSVGEADDGATPEDTPVVPQTE